VSSAQRWAATKELLAIGQPVQGVIVDRADSYYLHFGFLDHHPVGRPIWVRAGRRQSEKGLDGIGRYRLVDHGVDVAG